MHAVWAAFSAAFLASAVEFVEAFTIVLVVGLTINWRSALAGTAAATATLALIVVTLGVAITRWVPLETLRLVIGVLLLLFGLQWLKKAILRASGLKAQHDELAVFEKTAAALRAQGLRPVQRLEPAGVVLSYKAVFLEGLEVAFIVVTMGGSVTAPSCDARCGLGSAALGALAAGLLVVLVGWLVRAPLARVPENTLKFIVGLMLTTFGTFWSGEGLGLDWPLADAFLLVLLAGYTAVALLLVALLRRQTPAKRAGTTPQWTFWRANALGRALYAVYDFVAGDSVLLVGVAVTLVVLAALRALVTHAPGGIELALLVIAIVVTLLASLGHEVGMPVARTR